MNAGVLAVQMMSASRLLSESRNKVRGGVPCGPTFKPHEVIPYDSGSFTWGLAVHSYTRQRSPEERSP